MSIKKDEFFTRDMLSVLNGPVIVKSNFPPKKKHILNRQIKFLRKFGLLPNSHKNLVVNIN